MPKALGLSRLALALSVRLYSATVTSHKIVKNKVRKGMENRDSLFWHLFFIYNTETLQMQTFRRNNVIYHQSSSMLVFPNSLSHRSGKNVENQRIYSLGGMFCSDFGTYRIAEVFKNRYHNGHRDLRPFLSFACRTDLFRYQDRQIIKKSGANTFQ